MYDFLNKNVSNLYCLTRLPDVNISFNFNNVLILNLNGCKLIKNKDVDAFINLLELNMSNCNQETIGNGFIDKLTKLQVLYM